MLKNMLKILKEETEQQDKLMQESINLAQHLKTTDVIKQAVDSLSSNKYISSDVLLTFLETLKERLVSGKCPIIILYNYFWSDFRIINFFRAKIVGKRRRFLFIFRMYRTFNEII